MAHGWKWHWFLQILDERSLIKKYQKEISSLKSELERLKRGILQQPYVLHANHEHHLAHLRQQVWMYEQIQACATVIFLFQYGI